VPGFSCAGRANARSASAANRRHVGVQYHPTVYVQKDERSVQPGTLVPVNERLVLGDVERIRGRHLEEIFVKKLVIKRSLWRCYGRLECTPVADSRRAAEKAKLVVVQCQHVLD
jgi:hypothetical protein